MTTDLDELDALRAAATPGEWWIEHPQKGDGDYLRPCQIHSPSGHVADCLPADADFIAAARNAVGPLIERVREAEAKWKAALEVASNDDVVVELRDLWTRALADKNEAIRLMSELMQRTPSMGEDQDGFIMGYVLPTGPLHRIASFLTQHGQSFGHVKHYADEKFANTDPIARAEAAEARVAYLEKELAFKGCSGHREEIEAAEQRARVAIGLHKSAETDLAALEAGIRALAEGWKREATGIPEARELERYRQSRCADMALALLKDGA